MKYTRWYDNNSDLQSLLSFLENINENTLKVISADFLQILTERYEGKFDEVIAKISENAPPSYSRWYDEDYELHTCIEFLKILDEQNRKELISEFKESLRGFIRQNEKIS